MRIRGRKLAFAVVLFAALFLSSPPTTHAFVWSTWYNPFTWFTPVTRVAYGTLTGTIAIANSGEVIPNAQVLIDGDVRTLTSGKIYTNYNITAGITHTIVCIAPGQTNQTYSKIVTAGSTVTQDCYFDAAAANITVTVHGIVKDLAGNLVNDSPVTVAGTTVRTGSNGVYTRSNFSVPVSNTQITLTFGCTTPNATWWRTVVAGDNSIDTFNSCPVSTTGGGAPPPPPVGTNSLSGRITLNGATASGATVRTTLTTGYNNSMLTNGSGDYGFTSLTGLPSVATTSISYISAGRTYQASVMKYLHTGPNTIDYDLTSANATGGNGTPPPPAPTQGRLIGLITANGNATSGITATLEGGSLSSPKTYTTDVGGSFSTELFSLPQTFTKLTLKYQSISNIYENQDKTQSIVLNRAEQTVRWDITSSPTSLSGTVSYSVSGTNWPVPRATVSLKPDGSVQAITAQTDLTGHYQFDKVQFNSVSSNAIATITQPELILDYVSSSFPLQRGAANTKNFSIAPLYPNRLIINVNYSGAPIELEGHSDSSVVGTDTKRPLITKVYKISYNNDEQFVAQSELDPILASNGQTIQTVDITNNALTVGNYRIELLDGIGQQARHPATNQNVTFSTSWGQTREVNFVINLEPTPGPTPVDIKARVVLNPTTSISAGGIPVKIVDSSAPTTVIATAQTDSRGFISFASPNVRIDERKSYLITAVKTGYSMGNTKIQFYGNNLAQIQGAVYTVVLYKDNAVSECVNHPTSALPEFWFCGDEAKTMYANIEYTSYWSTINDQIALLQSQYTGLRDTPPEVVIESKNNITSVAWESDQSQNGPSQFCWPQPIHDNTPRNNARIEFDTGLLKLIHTSFRSNELFLLKVETTHEEGHEKDFRESGCNNGGTAMQFYLIGQKYAPAFFDNITEGKYMMAIFGRSFIGHPEQDPQETYASTFVVNHFFKSEFEAQAAQAISVYPELRSVYNQLFAWVTK